MGKFTKNVKLIFTSPDSAISLAYLHGVYFLRISDTWEINILNVYPFHGHIMIGLLFVAKAKCGWQCAKHLYTNIFQVSFEDIFAEPDAIHSHDCVWRLSYKCFNCGKDLCYMILTFLCAVPTALCWGCTFAEVAFQHIWEIAPYLRLLEINCFVCSKIFKTILSCCLAPCCETCGLFFSQITVKNQ